MSCLEYDDKDKKNENNQAYHDGGTCYGVNEKVSRSKVNMRTVFFRASSHSVQFSSSLTQLKEDAKLGVPKDDTNGNEPSKATEDAIYAKLKSIWEKVVGIAEKTLQLNASVEFKHTPNAHPHMEREKPPDLMQCLLLFRVKCPIQNLGIVHLFFSAMLLCSRKTRLETRQKIGRMYVFVNLLVLLVLLIFL